MNDWDLTAAGANKKIEELEDSLATRFLDRNGIIMVAINEAIQSLRHNVTITVKDKKMFELIIPITAKLRAHPYLYTVNFFLSHSIDGYCSITISWPKK